MDCSAVLSPGLREPLLPHLSPVSEEGGAQGGLWSGPRRGGFRRRSVSILGNPHLSPLQRQNRAEFSQVWPRKVIVGGNAGQKIANVTTCVVQSPPATPSRIDVPILRGFAVLMLRKYGFCLDSMRELPIDKRALMSSI